MARYSNENLCRTLTEALDQYTVPELRQLAGLIASNLPTRKAEIIAVILSHMADPVKLRQLWQQLDQTQQAAVAETIYSNQITLDVARFKAKYGAAPDLGGFKYGYLSKGQPTYLHLFLHRYQVPLDLKEQLKALVPRPRPVKIKTSDQPPDMVSQRSYTVDYQARRTIERQEEIPVIQLATELAARQDIQAVLRLIDVGQVRVSDKTNRVTAAGATAITGVLYGGDFYPADEPISSWDKTSVGPIKAFAWPLLLQSASLAELAGTKLQLTAAGKKALAAPPEQAIRTAWRKWLKSTLLDEFNRIHTIKGQTGKGKRQLTSVAGRRAAIANALAECPANEWLAFDEFSRYMQAAGHTFEVARDLWHLYIADPNYGSLGDEGFGGWHIVQGRYILAFLFEYAATLGLIDVAYIPPVDARRDYKKLWGVDDLECLSRYDGLLYFRLNNLGAWLLGQTDRYTPSPVRQESILKVLPNFDVVATAPLPAGDQLFLEQFAPQTADQVWKIDRATLLRAVEDGQSVAAIQEFLQAKSGGSLPNPVQVLLGETAERVSSLQNKGEALLIEARDTALAQLIANDSSLRSLCWLAGEQMIVVPKENEVAFRRSLRKLGYGVSSQ